MNRQHAIQIVKKAGLQCARVSHYAYGKNIDGYRFICGFPNMSDDSDITFRLRIQRRREDGEYAYIDGARYFVDAVQLQSICRTTKPADNI